MRAEQRDRITQADTQRRHSTQTLLTAIAVLILAGAVYLLSPGDDERDSEDTAADASPEESVPLPTPPEPEPDDAILAAPDIPVVESMDEVAEEEDTPEAQPVTEPLPMAEPVSEPAPPTPEEIDAELREALAGEGIQPAELIAPSLNAPYLLDRGISSADQLARGLVPRRTLNLAPPQGRFAVQREGQRYRVDPAGYARYDAIVAAITALPAERFARLFQQFRPQLTDAYASLGYPPDAMDNTIVAALDSVLSAPLVEEPPYLQSRGALWAYEDPALEGRNDLHRQLLRTGPANTRALQTWAQRLRDALLNP
ncbi:MAG: DUF3014 domain-containing protein [Pseudomonadota bacterium]